MTPDSKTRPNILLIVLDSVRASNTSLHNYSKKTTPTLEKLAQQSTVYEQARAPSIWSLPSHVSIFTGESPHVHGVNTGEQTLESGHTIWEYLSSEFGYSTGLFTSNIYLTEASVGLSKPFDTVAGRSEVVPYPDALTPMKADSSSGIRYVENCISHDNPIQSFINGVSVKGQNTLTKYSILDNILPQDNCGPHSKNFQKWAEDQTGPWAACINFMDAHLPYKPDDDFDEWGGKELKRIQKSIGSLWDYVNEDQPWWKCEALSNLYDGAILQMDSEIQNIIEYLKNRGEYDNTHIVITGDHGEGFGESCYVRPDVRYTAHGYGINDKLLHVPLLSKRPGQQQAKCQPNLASLTSFFDVISSVVNNSNKKESFRKDEVYVSSIERTQQMENHVTKNSKYRDDAFAVYQNNKNTIQKFTKWGDDKIKVNFAKTPQAPILSLSSNDCSIIDQILDQSESGLLRDDKSDSDEYNEDVMSRLEDLGYA
jgi:arylsulfatase A-like enzyme